MSVSSDNPLRAATFEVGFEGEPPAGVSVGVFVFDQSGNYVSHALLKDGRAHVALPASMPSRARVLIAPLRPNEPAPTLRAIQARRPYQPSIDLSAGAKSLKLPPIPRILWPYWLWCECLILGQVVKSVNGVDFPVCNARVHICEVEPLFLLLNELQDAQILRLRDDFVQALRSPTLPLPPPGPPVESRLNRVVSSARRATATDAPAALAPPAAPAVDASTLAALTSHSPIQVRAALTENLHLLWPFWCLWPWWSWIFDRLVEIAVETTDATGHFSYEHWHLCRDNENLYFWVEFSIGGVWTAVYNPPVPCNVYWDYACGSSVTLRISDSRVPACGSDADLPGKSVVLMSIGHDFSPAQIQSVAGTAGEGLTTDATAAPFGGSIEPNVAFSRTALIGSGITHYRWSYRQMTNGQGNPVPGATGPWTNITTPVYRHYEVQDPNPPFAISFPTDLLGPDPAYPGANLFRIQPVIEPGEGYVVADARADTASAFFVTPAPAIGDADPAAGKYELKLELFNPGVDPTTAVDMTAEGIAVALATTSAPFGSQTVVTTPADAEHTITDGVMNVLALRIVLHVDNSYCLGTIHDVQVAGGSGLGSCGFYTAPSATADVTVSFDASHPNGLATYEFDVARGSGGIIHDLSSAGTVTSQSPGYLYVQSGSTFSQTRTAFSWCNTVNTGSPPADCPNGAFAEYLYVYALATDGWSRLDYLDAPIGALGEIGLAAFALTWS